MLKTGEMFDFIITFVDLIWFEDILFWMILIWYELKYFGRSDLIWFENIDYIWFDLICNKYKLIWFDLKGFVAITDWNN